jgi:hypothetical protein
VAAVICASRAARGAVTNPHLIHHQEAEGESAVVRCVWFSAGIWCLGQALEVAGRVSWAIAAPIACGAAGISPATIWRMRRASAVFGRKWDY